VPDPLVSKEPEDLNLFVYTSKLSGTNNFENENCGSLFEILKWHNYENETKIVDQPFHGRPAQYYGDDDSPIVYTLRHLITGNVVICK